MFHWTRLRIWYTADGLHFGLKRVGINLVFLTCMPCASGELLPCVQLVWPALSCTGSNSTVITDSAVPYSQLGNHQSCCGCVDFHQLVLQTAFRCRRFPSAHTWGLMRLIGPCSPSCWVLSWAISLLAATPARLEAAVLIGEVCGARLHFKIHCNSTCVYLCVLGRCAGSTGGHCQYLSLLKWSGHSHMDRDEGNYYGKHGNLPASLWQFLSAWSKSLLFQLYYFNQLYWA